MSGPANNSQGWPEVRRVEWRPRPPAPLLATSAPRPTPMLVVGRTCLRADEPCTPYRSEAATPYRRQWAILRRSRVRLRIRDRGSDCPPDRFATGGAAPLLRDVDEREVGAELTELIEGDPAQGVWLLGPGGVDLADRLALGKVPCNGGWNRFGIGEGPGVTHPPKVGPATIPSGGRTAGVKGPLVTNRRQERLAQLGRPRPPATPVTGQPAHRPQGAACLGAIPGTQKPPPRGRTSEAASLAGEELTLRPASAVGAATLANAKVLRFLGTATRSGDRFGQAAWVAVVDMFSSCSMGVGRPSAGCRRRRW
jgi:hypothetical protein